MNRDKAIHEIKSALYDVFGADFHRIVSDTGSGATKVVCIVNDTSIDKRDIERICQISGAVDNWKLDALDYELELTIWPK